MTTPDRVDVKPGFQSTEFWSKLIIQLVILLGDVFGIELNLDAETKALIVSVLEGVYQAGRPYVKRAAYLSKMQPRQEETAP